MARPTVRNEDINRKIEQCAALGATVEEIAFYAGIHRDTLYDWMKKDKMLSDRIHELQEKPILKARQTVVKSLDIPSDAQWYLERKRKKEFSLRHEFTGEDGKDLPQPIINVYQNISNGSDNVLDEKDKRNTRRYISQQDGECINILDSIGTE